MRIDAALPGATIAGARALAAPLEEAGFDGLFTFDGPGDPFLALAPLAPSTRLDLATGVAIALARNPMTVAQAAHDLAVASGGRFTLGLGSQVRAHVRHRFSMPWDRPVSRMREFVAALRAIFACWNEEAPLRFEGEFYSHTLMPPLLRPAACVHGAPPILLAAVGTPMLRAAAEVADGCVLHPFHSQAWLRSVALPVLSTARGTESRPFQVTAQVLVVTGADEAEMASVRGAVRAQLSFYASTPAYRGVLEADGLGDLQGELRRLSKEGRWSEMPGLLDDAALERYAVVGTPEDAGRELARRYHGVASRVALATPLQPGAQAAAALVAGFHSEAARLGALPPAPPQEAAQDAARKDARSAHE